MSKIIILGDLFPKHIIDFPKINSNDFCVANLECAITNSEKPIKKDGPSLRINQEEAKVINQLGVNLVGIANNHIMDFGVEGFKDTVSFLDSAGIKHAGSTIDKSYFIKDIGHRKVCFYFVSEHQYNYFKSEKVGVNVLNQHNTFNEISNLKKLCDFLIVCFHGGKEYYLYPTPLQQSNCHRFVDSGANLVICQHSHCVGCKEIYKNATIIYGQGNFAFPYSENEHFKTGVIVELTLDVEDQSHIELIPIVHREQFVIRYASEKESKDILKKFSQRSLELEQKTCEALYDAMISECGFDFLYRLFNKSKLYVRLDTSRFFKNRMMKKYVRKNQKYLLYLYNYFNCETHVEYIKAILEKQIKNEGKK